MKINFSSQPARRERPQSYNGKEMNSANSVGAWRTRSLTADRTSLTPAFQPGKPHSEHPVHLYLAS